MKNLKWFSRILALLLVATMILAGCGPANVEDPTDPPKQTDGQDNPPATNAPEKPYWELLDEVSDTSELPDWEGDVLEITMWVVGPADANLGKIPETDVAFKELERVTGIRYNIEESYGSGGNSIDAKLPMVLASKDLPHLILGYGHNTQLQELFENDYLVDLTEYYKDGTLDQLTKYMPVDETWDYVYNQFAKGGKIYGLPTVLSSTETAVVPIWDAAGYYPENFDAAYYNQYGKSPASWSGNAGDIICIREDILKAVRPDALMMADIEKIYMENGAFTEEQIFNLGLKSADDFWTLLRDIKKELDANPGKYLDSNGKDVEIMAGIFTEEDNWRYSVNLLGQLYQTPASTDYFLVANYDAATEAELLEYGYTSDLYQNHWKTMNQLVREGILSANSWVDNKAAWQEKDKAGHYLVTYGGLCTNETEDFRFVPVWIDGEYNSLKQGGFSGASYPYFYGLFEGAFESEEEIEQFLHAVNYLNSEVGTNNFVWGPKSAGLFEEDADGNRTYVSEALYTDMVLHQANGEAQKYGLYNIYGGEQLGDVWFPKGLPLAYLSQNLLYADDKEPAAADARRYFNPGTLPGRSQGENSVYTKTQPTLYSWGMSFDFVQQFWAGRTGFENQIKKMIVAPTEADYQKELDELIAYCQNSGLTDEALKTMNDTFVNENRDMLKAAGFFGG